MSSYCRSDTYESWYYLMKVSFPFWLSIYETCITLDQEECSEELDFIVVKSFPYRISKLTYDPSCVDKIYLFPKHDSTIYWDVLYQPKSSGAGNVILASLGDTRSRKNLHYDWKIIAKALLVESWINLFETPLLDAKNGEFNFLVCQIASVYLKLNWIKSVREMRKLSNTSLKPDETPSKDQELLFHLSQNKMNQAIRQFVPNSFWW